MWHVLPKTQVRRFEERQASCVASVTAGGGACRAAGCRGPGWWTATSAGRSAPTRRSSTGCCATWRPWGSRGAPRVVGVDGDEEVLTYVAGHVPVEVERRRSDRSCSRRRAWPRRSPWSAATTMRWPDRAWPAGPRSCATVTCPWNTVYGDRGVALIDWDGARPGARLDDVGYATWRHLMLGFPGAPGLGQQRRLLAAAALGLRPVRARDPARRRGRGAGGPAPVFEAARAAGDPLPGSSRRALETIDGARRWLADHGGRLLR